MQQDLLASRYPQIADPTAAKLLELTNQPGIISFAGGIPAPATFPAELVAEAQAKIKLDLQYSSAQGVLGLREVVAQRLSSDWGRRVTADQVLITSGSQQALDLVGRTFLNPGETVLVEDPTYFVALYALSAYGVRYQTIDWKKPRGLLGAKLAYVVSNYQNPTGETLTQVERQVIATMLASCETLLIEDDPYGELYFGRRPPLPIATLAPKQTIYITSLSKIMGPALRLGIVVAETEMIEQLTRVKTGMDLCTSAMTQGIATEVLANPRFEAHLGLTRRYYARQARAMQKVLKRYMPQEVSWTHPQGGMFVWLTLPPRVDTAELYERAIARGVAFVPGYIFRPNRDKSNHLRLSFSLSSREQITNGMQILGELMRKVKKYV